VLQEARPESIEGAMKRTAAEVARIIVEAYEKHNWR
jgi:hypothetical protein